MKGLEVLLVDDEIEFITTLSERLMLRGIQTSMATDGESALRRIEKDPPDVVIMDLLMPGINGLELLKQIGSRNPDVSVILLSGRGNEEDCQRGKLLGAVDFLIKPVDINDLLNILRKNHES